MQEQTECGVRTLEEYLDKEVFILMRDNTSAQGILRSFDQYHNVLLEDAKEITILGDEYSEVESEVCMLRGENIILLGHNLHSPKISLKKVDHLSIVQKAKAEAPEDDLNYITLE